MAKTDWNLRDTIRPEDMNELGQEINEHGGKIAEQGLVISEHDKTILEQGTKITEQGKSISVLENRLDTEEYAEITLQPGLQAVKVERDARFRLGSIKGRTLINLLGSAGGCEDVYQWGAAQATSTFDSTNKIYGNNSIKLAIASGYTVGNIYKSIPVTVGKCYIFVGELKNGTAINARLEIFNKDGNINLAQSDFVTDKTKFNTAYTKITAQEDMLTLSATIYGSGGEHAFIDGLRLYEITQAEYDELDIITLDQVAAKYPFVPVGINGVENPYVIRCGENLLPPFYEWVITPQARVISPYSLSISNTAGQQNSYVTINVLPNTQYTLSGDVKGGTTSTGGYFTIGWMNQEDEYILWEANIFTGGSPKTVTSPSNAVKANVTCAVTADIGKYSFLNPMLTLGIESRPFKPREDAMLAFQTELHANPHMGAEPDELFENNGQYFKLSKWKKVELNGSLDWLRVHVSGTGFKGVIAPAFTLSDNVYSHTGYVTRFDGLQLPRVTSPELINKADVHYLDINNIVVSIANADSGWGDVYTPTADEIKAYFNGWKLFDTSNGSSWTTPYNRSDGLNKGWAKIYSGIGTEGTGQSAGTVAGSGTTVLPTVINDMSYAQYNLLYRLARETVEPVVSEGCLKLSEGDNLVEVGTGIVLRERAYPAYYAEGGVGYYWLNNYAVDSVVGGNNTFKYLSNDIRYIYNGNKSEKSKWATIKNHSSASSNGEIAFITAADYDQFGTYSVTYLKLDKSPIVPISGSVAVNEKAQLSNLTAGIAEALHGVSVLTMKKADMDKLPSVVNWIYPTLLNGWTLSSNGAFPAQYHKYENGIVHMNGIVNSGTSGSIIFNLPPGYRPKKTHRISAVISSGTNFNFAFFDVTANGNVTATFSGNVMHLPLHCSFLAEQ